MRVTGRSCVYWLLSPAPTKRLAVAYHNLRTRRRTHEYLRRLPSYGLRVNLGCGERLLPAWINLDSFAFPGVQVVWDLRRGIPFPDGSCSALLLEHVIEHLPREAAKSLLSQCIRVLEPGGALRISTPDAERYLRSYTGDRRFLLDTPLDAPADTPMDRINHIMRWHGGHLWLYDADSLGLLAREAGFEHLDHTSYGVSAHPALHGVDHPGRAFESLYLDAFQQRT